MDIVEKRFESFKELIKSIKNVDETYIFALSSINLALFLHGLKDYLHLTTIELVAHIMTKANINRESIDDSEYSKFVDYLNYFRDILAEIDGVVPDHK